MATTGKRGNPGTDLTDNHNKVFMEQLDDDAVELTASTAAAAANTLKTAMLTNAVAGTGAILTLAEPTGGGTSAVTMTAPALAGARVITVPDADVTLANIAANSLKTALITNAVAGTGAIITLLEPTGGGTDAVTIECPALGAARVITIPDANVTLANIAVNTADITAVSVGAAGTNVTAVEYGGKQHMTVLTLTDVVLGAPTAGGNSAHGAEIYVFPAGVHMQRHTQFSVGLTMGGVTTDTPDVGIGSVIGAGAIALLNGTTMEDYVTAITWATALDGTAEVQDTIPATAGLYIGIANNAAADVKEVYFNVADGWNAGVTGNITASGTVVIIWETIG